MFFINSWLLLALVASFLFAVVNLIDDNLVRKVYKSSYFGATISGLFGALPLLTLFLGDPEGVQAHVFVFGILGGLLTTVYYFLYFKSLESGSPSVTVALYNLAPAVIPFFAYLLLDERLSKFQILGFVIILASSLALSVIDIKKFKFTKELYFMTAASLLFAAATLMQKYVYENTNFYTGYMLFAAGMGAGGIMFLLIQRIFVQENFFKLFKNNPWKILVFFVIAEVIGITAELTQNLAIDNGPVSLVTIAEGLQPAFILGIAVLLYKFYPKLFREAAEGGLSKKFALISVMLVGLYFINK